MKMRSARVRAAVVLVVVVLAFSGLLWPETVPRFGSCNAGATPEYHDLTLRSLYVPMKDGTRIAIDVVLPSPLPPGTKLPAILMMTRYWRRTATAGFNEIERLFTSHGYAVVTGDSRGTGASFGVWRYNRSPGETRDFGEIADWMAAQPWSNGRVGAYGTSYAANTADWIAQNKRPQVKAIEPRFPDFDVYTDLYFPGGVFHYSFAQGWSDLVRKLDLNVPPLEWQREQGRREGDLPVTVRRVDDDKDGLLLGKAVAERAGTPEVYAGHKQITFRDDQPSTWGASIDDWSIHKRLADLEQSHASMFSWGGWMDAGTADGVLKRFMTLDNPQVAVIGPWSHGGRHHASPYLPPDAPTDPPIEQQMQESLCYFDRTLKSDTPLSGKVLTYYTMGEEKWKSTNTWPPVGSTPRRWYLEGGNRLTSTLPVSEAGSDRYTVDFDVSTGKTNRWFTNWTGGDVVYSDRADSDRQLLTYTTDPLKEDVEITGQAVATLFVSSTTSDGAFFVYLEDVWPDGRTNYVTEGELRAIHRKISSTPPYKMLAPYHSFLRKDAVPLIPGEISELSFGLMPTSVLIRRGHRLRIAIAGADKDTFQRIPENETPVISVQRNKKWASYVDLPVIQRPGTK